MVPVLLIDDSEPDCALVKRYLRATDYNVFATATAALAIKFLSTSASAARIILLDLRLPNGEGIELVRRILAKAGTTPVVVLTGHADLDLAQTAIAEGVKGYLNKSRMDTTALVAQLDLALASVPKPRADEPDTVEIIKGHAVKLKEAGDEAIDVLEKKVPK